MVLEAYGYSVLIAHNGADALRQLSSGIRPTAILLDLNMPVMDGFQFRMEQLQQPAIADIPVIAVSAHSDAVANAQRLQATAYLCKPVDPEDLVSALATLTSTDDRARSDI